MTTTKEKLELLSDERVIAIVMDSLHKRRSRYSKADNSGQHADYKDMIEEMRKDYEKQIQKATERDIMRDQEDTLGIYSGDY